MTNNPTWPPLRCTRCGEFISATYDDMDDSVTIECDLCGAKWDEYDNPMRARLLEPVEPLPDWKARAEALERVVAKMLTMMDVDALRKCPHGASIEDCPWKEDHELLDLIDATLKETKTND